MTRTGTLPTIILTIFLVAMSAVAQIQGARCRLDGWELKDLQLKTKIENK